MIKDDYARTGVPMLPVVKGDADTRRQILIYSVILVAFTVMPFVTGLFGVPYLVAALALGGTFIGLADATGPRALAPGGPAPLPVVARLPGAAVLRHGSRQGALIEPAAMDRRLARRNIKGGLLAGSIALAALALTFFFAILYIG